MRIWNRSAAREEIEQVYGDRLVRLLYGSSPGQLIADQVLSRAVFSRLYGSYQSSRASRHKIEPFIRDFKIDMNEFERGPFATFNDFFIRRFRPGVRQFATRANALPAFAEARYFAYDGPTSDRSFQIKGEALDRAQMLGGVEKATRFQGGPVLIARLCPTDYHRFHYPDEGTTISGYRLAGPLHSVNPLALRGRPGILASNERRVSILSTRNFGQLAYVEVGALCVGKIIQTHLEKTPFSRGAEKGYFLFGASTVVLLGETGAWKPSADILAQTEARRETLVRLGEEIASS
ncbi:MAG: hypothetical protein A2X94_05090 [Bdellovibrionales bacterium GWB1_55_8]|nr:MAG: hypothetical protein A2X94_05090 [Bdellovibrionales bacterium GWB1_55_8]